MEQLETGKNKKQGKKERSILALSPREVLEVYSRIRCGAFSGHSHDENLGCAMTVATMATLRDSELTDKTEDMGFLPTLEARHVYDITLPPPQVPRGLLCVFQAQEFSCFFLRLLTRLTSFSSLALVSEKLDSLRKGDFLKINSVTHNCEIFCLEIS